MKENIHFHTDSLRKGINPNLFCSPTSSVIVIEMRWVMSTMAGYSQIIVSMFKVTIVTVDKRREKNE